MKKLFCVVQECKIAISARISDFAISARIPLDFKTILKLYNFYKKQRLKNLLFD